MLQQEDPSGTQPAPPAAAAVHDDIQPSGQRMVHGVDLAQFPQVLSDLWDALGPLRRSYTAVKALYLAFQQEYPDHPYASYHVDLFMAATFIARLAWPIHLALQSLKQMYGLTVPNKFDAMNRAVTRVWCALKAGV